ncbi:MAG: hypothetical protein M3083_05580 [Actinomycetota bacterium]|nr:hypothetical protein [Actinomycetota bacterium]
MTVVVLVAVFGAIWGEFIWALVDAARRPEYLFRPACRLSKASIIVLILITGFIGATYYFIRLRPSLIRASRMTTLQGAPRADQGDRRAWKVSHDPWA